MKNWTFTDLDQKIASEVQKKLPSKVFDAHAHLWRQTDLAQPIMGVLAKVPDEVGVKIWRSHIGRQVGPGRLVGGLLIPSPTGIFRKTEHIPRANAYLFEQITGDPNLKGRPVAHSGFSRLTS